MLSRFKSFFVLALLLLPLSVWAQFQPQPQDPPGFYFPPYFNPQGAAGTGPQDIRWEYEINGILGSIYPDWDSVNSPILGSFDELSATWKHTGASASCPGAWSITTLGAYFMQDYTTPPATQPPSQEPNVHAQEAAQAAAAAAAEQASLAAIATATGPNSGITPEDIARDVKGSSLGKFIDGFGKTLCPKGCKVQTDAVEKPSMRKIFFRRGGHPNAPRVHSYLVRKTIKGKCIKDEKEDEEKDKDGDGGDDDDDDDEKDPTQY